MNAHINNVGARGAQSGFNHAAGSQGADEAFEKLNEKKTGLSRGKGSGKVANIAIHDDSKNINNKNLDPSVLDENGRQIFRILADKDGQHTGKLLAVA